MAKRKSDVGTLYKGSPGQWSWLLHRITGVAVILFLFAHVVDTAVVGWGPEAYNRVVSVYHNWVVKLLELGLVAAVLYHAINGVKIMVFDFWPGTTRHMKGIALASTVIFVLSMIPVTWIMGQGILEDAGSSDGRRGTRTLGPGPEVARPASEVANGRSAASSSGRGCSCGSADWCCSCSRSGTS